MTPRVGLAVLLVAALVLAGCAAPAAVTTTPSPAAPAPRTPEPEPEPLLRHAFGEDPTRDGWSVGFWDADRRLEGRHETRDGWLHLSMDEGRRPPPAGYALGHDLTLPPEGARAEALVRADVLQRFGLYLMGDGQWLGLEVDAEGFCACSHGPSGWRIDFFGPASAGVPYALSLTLLPGGRALAEVRTPEGERLAATEVSDVLLEPGEVERVWLGVWTDEPGDALSTYQVGSIKVVPR